MESKSVHGVEKRIGKNKLNKQVIESRLQQDEDGGVNDLDFAKTSEVINLSMQQLDELQEAWGYAVEAAKAFGHVGPQMARACTLAGRVQSKAGLKSDG